jgi:hypothetical protein
LWQLINFLIDCLLRHDATQQAIDHGSQSIAHITFAKCVTSNQLLNTQ